MQRQPAFEQTFSDALDRALQGVLGRAAKVTSFYIDPGMSAKSPDVYVELLKRIFSPDLVNALVDSIGMELSKSFGFPFQQDMNGRLSEYVNYARQPLQLMIEPESGSTLVLDSDKELKVTLANRTVGEMIVKNCELKLSPEILLLEPDKPGYGVDGLKLNPGESHVLKARIRGSQVGQARVIAQGTIIDLRGRLRVVEAPSTLFVVEREGRLSTGSSVADSLLLGGLPRRSAVLLTGGASDEKDSLIQGFCSIAPSFTVYVSSDVNRSTQFHRFYPELRLVVCGPQADLLPSTESVQV